jgi:hypothetical protein
LDSVLHLSAKWDCGQMQRELRQSAILMVVLHIYSKPKSVKKNTNFSSLFFLRGLRAFAVRLKKHLVNK